MSERRVLLERRLLVTGPEDNQPREIVIEIGHPYWIDEAVEAACPVAIHGLGGRVHDIHGIDLLDAMELSIKFVHQTLEHIKATHKLSWPDGEPYFEEQTP